MRFSQDPSDDSHNAQQPPKPEHSTGDLTDLAVRPPRIKTHHGVDVMTFQSVWQIKLLLEPTFVDFIIQYIERHERPYRLVLCLENISGLSLSDLGNLVAVFSPFLEDNGVICLCNLQQAVRELITLHFLDCMFLICSNLDEAIQAVQDID